MDATRFDSLTRALASPTSRRGVLRVLLGGAGIAAGMGRFDASALQAESDAARKGAFWRAGKRCSGPDRCGSKAPCSDGRCLPNSCLVGLNRTVPAGTANPDNTCAFCIPSSTSWTGWAGTMGDGTACEVSGAAADPCLSTAGRCIDGDCIRDPLPNGELCGAGEVCCGGACCTATQCCGESETCEECGPHCTIGDDTPPEGTPNPDGSCTICNPSADPFYWSTAPDDMRCGPNRDGFCCAGTCQPEPCEPQCLIEDVPYEADDVNLDNRCQACQPAQSTSAWTTLPDDASCGIHPAQHRVCCGGVCCLPAQCCGDDGQCSFACDQICLIGDEESGVAKIPDGEPNPDNLCEECNVIANPNGWTKLDFPAPCGSAELYRICCAGICCAPGETCNPVTLRCVEDCGTGDGNRLDGECAPEPDGCTIDGVAYGSGEHNLENPCQQCDVNISATSWSPVSIAMCGPAGDRFCSGGVCCDLGICPDLAANVCGDYCDDVCVIGGVKHRGEDRNPANPCEHCAPSANHTAWSLVPRFWYCDPAAQTGACYDGACIP